MNIIFLIQIFEHNYTDNTNTNYINFNYIIIMLIP